MHTSFSPWAALLPVLLAALPAQSPPGLATSMRTACGLQQLDGELWGIGPDYKVAFRADGVEFTPALGKRAPHNLPLQLRVLGVERGGQLVAATATAPKALGLQARYEHAGFVERYDVSAKGIEQSFVFASLPPGDGDLVVRLAVQTELPLAAAGGDGLRFFVPDLGGVAIGGVTGIDARGAATPGAVTCDGATLELRLPAAFVDHAALPLVLDPQIGAVFPVTSSIADYEDPDLAAPYAAGGSYLCAFTFALSATDHDIRAIRLSSSGGTSGALFAITTGTGNDDNPTVGSVAARNAFVIVYHRGGDLFVRSILATNVVSSEYTAASGSDTQVEPDLASEITNLASHAVLVFRNSTANSIQCATVNVFSSGLVAVSAPLTVATGSLLTALGRPRISHDGGDTGRNLIVYPRTTFGGDTKTHAVLIDRDVGVLAGTALTSGSNDEDSADVDGNGLNWVVAFETEPAEGSGDNDIVALALNYDPAQGTIHNNGLTPITTLVDVDEIDPAVACFRSGSCMVAWRRRAGPGSSNTEVFMKTVDQVVCLSCEPTVLLANTSDIEQNLTAAAAALADDNGLVLWETSTSAGANGDLNGIAWEAQDGRLATPLGGQGCGVPLTATAGCVRVGVPYFYAEVFGADGPSMGVFVLSATTSWITCGQCRLYANPFDGIAVYPVVGVEGFALTQIMVPSLSALRGTTVYTQWLVSNPNGACSYLQADFSNALAITIE